MLALRMCVLVMAAASVACGGGGGGAQTLLDVSGGTDTVTGDVAVVDTAEADVAGADVASADVAGADGALADTAAEDGGAPPDDGAASEDGVVEPPAGISAEWLQDKCEDWCSLQDVCGDGIMDLEACADDCFAAAGDADYLAQVVCGAMGWDDEEPECAVLGLCDDPLTPEICATSCGTIDDCGLLGKQSEDFFGTTLAECILMCSAFGTVVPGGQFDAALECMEPAAAACDFLAILECLGVSGICDDLCGSDGAAAECGLIPAQWAEEGACYEACEALESGPGIAMQVCIGTLIPDPEDPGPFGDGDCADLAAARCMDPPAELPEGAAGTCEALDATCGEGAAIPGMPSPEVCGWFITGFLMAAPPGVFHSDHAAASECISELETCEDGAWFACFIDPSQEVQDACELLIQCQEEVELPPGDEFDLTQCLFYLSVIGAQEPAVLEAALACIEAAVGCQQVFACLGPDE